MSEAEYSILRPNPEDFVFRFKGKAYPVLKGIFYCYSKKFALSPELQSQSEFAANFDVSEESFKEFINACQGKSFSISRDSIFDLEFLGNFWGVSDLRVKVAKIIKGDQTGKLRLDSALYKVQHKLGTDSDEQLLIDNLEDYIEDDRFAQLPIDALQRLLYTEKFASLDTDKKYQFLKKILLFHGKEGSSLFADLAKTPLEQDEIEKILHEKLILQPLTRNLARSTIQTSKHNGALSEINNDLNKAIKALINELKNSNNCDLNNTVEILQHASELGDRQASEILSEIYSEGIGVEQNEEKASEYTQKANDPNESWEAIADRSISDALDNSNDVSFDLEPSIVLPKPASPYEEFQLILSTPSTPTSPERGSPRHHRHPFSNRKDKPKPVGQQRRIPVAKPKNVKQEQEEQEESNRAHKRRNQKADEEDENAKELELLDENLSDDPKEGENEIKEREVLLEENENDDQLEEDHKNQTESDFVFESPGKKLGPFHDNGMVSESGNMLKRSKYHPKDGADAENSEPESEGGEKRLKIGEDKETRNGSKSCDVLLSPKGCNARRSSFSSDSKTHLPHHISEEEKIDYKLTDDDDIGQSVIALEKRAEKDDTGALFVLGVLYWGDGTGNAGADTEVEAGEAGVEVDASFKPDPQKAIKFYEKAAELGDPRSMFNLATIYDFYHGDNVEQDLPRAIELYTKAAEKGEVCAQTNLGVLYETGTGVEQNLEKAAEIYQKAADQGDSDAMLNLGMLYESGRGVESKDLGKAAELYKKAADQGDTDAQVKLGFLYEKGEVPGEDVDFSKAASLYRKAAENGNADAQFNLATMYENGTGVEKDDSKVFEWYSKSAENGNSDALFNLGVLHQNGKLEIPQDYSLAFNYYKRSADAGNPTAYYNMAVMLFNGEVEIDDEETSHKMACDYFLKSAELGCPEAQFSAGQLYEFGDCVEKDLAKAAQLYRQAADKGIVGAQYNLGVLYNNGEGGVEKDEDQAIHYFKLAADQGDSDAVFNLETLEKK